MASIIDDRIRASVLAALARAAIAGDVHAARVVLAESTTEIPIPSSERGTASWWCELLAAAAEAVARDERAAPRARTIASLALAAGKHAHDADMESRITELEAQDRRLAEMRRHGPSAERQIAPSLEAPMPGDPIDMRH